MARQFSSGSSQYLERDQAPVTAPPFSVHVWFKADAASGTQTMFWLGNKVSTSKFWQLRRDGNKVQLYLRTPGGSAYLASTTAYTAGVWHSATFVIAASNDRRLYYNGGNKQTQSSTVAPSGANRIAIGREGDASPGDYENGALAEIAVWNIALTDTDVSELANQASPSSVQASNLVSYWKLLGDNSPEPDSKGSYALTLFNNPVKASTHPAVGADQTMSAAAFEVASNVASSLGIQLDTAGINEVTSFGTNEFDQLQLLPAAIGNIAAFGDNIISRTGTQFLTASTFSAEAAFEPVSLSVRLWEREYKRKAVVLGVGF